MKITQLLTLFALLALSVFAADQTESVAVGTKLTLTADPDTAATPPVKLEWFRDGVKLSEGATLTIAALQLSDAGTYTVKASNAFGSATSDNYILVTGTAPTKPVIKSTLSQVTVQKQSAVRFEVTVENADRFQWLKNGQTLSGQTRSVLAFSRVNPSYAGMYALRASKGAESVTANIVDLHVR